MEIKSQEHMLGAIGKLMGVRTHSADKTLRYYSLVCQTSEIYSAQVWMCDDAGEDLENILHSGFCESWDEAYLNLKVKVQNYHERV